MKITIEHIAKLTRNVVAAMTMTETKDSSSTYYVMQVYNDIVLTVRGKSKHKEYYSRYALWGFRNPDDPKLLAWGEIDPNGIKKHKKNLGNPEHTWHLNNAKAAWANHEMLPRSATEGRDTHEM
ncbi:MAG: hypothetical protein P1Q69_10505 [Candidatus Thorarchaeota archaeon]|nr:hypothetical protein [Candidatus Thorarchaeota archaeon]